MADNKQMTGAQDRTRVSGEQQYEVAYFAQKHGLTAAQAREIIDLAGNDRARADELAKKGRGKTH